MRAAPGVWRFLLLFLAVGAALGAFVLTWMTWDAGARMVRLPDGREFTLRAVTFGREHRYVYGKPWAKPFALFVPKPWFGKFGLVELRYKTETPSVMFWGLWRTPPSISPFALSVDDAAVSDLGGTECEPIRFQTSAVAARGRLLVGWNFTSFPRRVSRLGFRLYFRDKDQAPNYAGECRVANPGFRDYPVWNGSPPPVSRTNGEWEFTLSHLVTQRKTERSKPALGYIGPYSTASCRVTRGGQVAEGWEAAAVALRDATGNVFRKTYLPAATSPAAPEFGFGSVFWPGEAGWNLEVEFARTRDFQADQLWTIPGIPVPVPNALTSHPSEHRFEGATLGGLELSLYETDRGGAVPRRGSIKLTMKPPLPHVRIRLVQVQDDQGRPVRFEPAYVNPSGLYGFNLVLAPGARALDCTFSAQTNQVVEFLVRPEIERSPLP